METRIAVVCVEHTRKSNGAVWNRREFAESFGVPSRTSLHEQLHLICSEDALTDKVPLVTVGSHLPGGEGDTSEDAPTAYQNLRGATKERSAIQAPAIKLSAKWCEVGVSGRRNTNLPSGQTQATVASSYAQSAWLT